MSFASPYAQVQIPTTSLYDYLFGDISTEDAERVALVDTTTGKSTTYGDMLAAVDSFAGALAARGIGVGDVVGLLAPNSSAFAIAFHGILRSGATATTINALFTAKDIAKQLVDSKAKLLVTVTQLLPQAQEAAATVGLAEDDVIVLDGAALGATEHAAPEVAFDPATHLAVLPYSSGTTADPKGVMLTHRNLTANVAQIRPVQGMSAEDRILAVLPFFHIYGMTVLLNAALHARAQLIIMGSFDLERFLGNIATHQCTYAFIAPPVAVALAKHPLVERYDLSSLRGIMSGAAPLDEELGEAVKQRLSCQVVQGYGMSELSPVSHVTPFDGGRELIGSTARLSSCGWTVPNAVSKIVDPDAGTEIDPPASGLSDTGELWFKGPNVMAGYLNNESATRETIDDDGFLHTGDVARVDATGCVYIVDRLKELIKYKGYQVPPAELEAVLLTHPGIADAAVIGVTDVDSGEEVPKAFVVKQSSVGGADNQTSVGGADNQTSVGGADNPAHAEVTEAEVIEYVASHVAPYKKVRQVAFVDAIPKSAAGKILRKELRNL